MKIHAFQVFRRGGSTLDAVLTHLAGLALEERMRHSIRW
jgi:hypothetical protein